MNIVSPLSYYSFGFFEDEPVPPKDFLNRSIFPSSLHTYSATEFKLTWNSASEAFSALDLLRTETTGFGITGEVSHDFLLRLPGPRA